MPMKKKILAIVLVLLLCGSIIPVSAIGGSSDDPLISLSYLRNTLKPQLTAAARASTSSALLQRYSFRQAGFDGSCPL